jgi:hypothetical protein
MLFVFVEYFQGATILAAAPMRLFLAICRATVSLSPTIRAFVLTISCSICSLDKKQAQNYYDGNAARLRCASSAM